MVIGSTNASLYAYVADGTNLVSLAMNGWADPEPAWWLNLQAQPDTTVVLPDGPRQVRARAATGAIQWRGRDADAHHRCVRRSLEQGTFSCSANPSTE